MGKHLNAIGQFHEEYLGRNKKRKEEVISIEMDFMPIQNHINSAIHQIDHFMANTKIIKQNLVKDMETIKQDFNQTAQSFQEISKFVRQSKLQSTINSIF